MKKQLLQMYGELDKNLFEKPSGVLSNNKPERGGLWTSSLLESDESDWTNFARTEEIYSEAQIESMNKFELSVDDNAKILVINSKEEYKQALLKYGQPIKGNHVLEYSCFMHEEPFVLDYDKLSKDFDAINLTRKGLRENYYEFYGWDVESTVWFTLDKLKITRIIK